MSEIKADRPTTEEIEITPEMIAAGRYELATYNRDYEVPEDAVLRIYLSMRALEPREKSG